MLYVAIGLFVLAAVFGLIVLTAILRNKPTPKPAVFIHGGIAVIALLIVIFYIAQHGSGPILSVTLFILAALGGLTLFTIDMQKKPIPKLIAIIHPLVAAAGLVALILYVIK